jgi:glycerol-3-phosphate dehydrogenase (NAD(P)+)
VYLSTDVIGVQLAGSLKNIYAIGAGLCDGMRLGDNAKAAYITRALYEMARVGVLLGGRIETFHGLSGVGDLIATCNGLWSRNRTFGEELAKGHSIDQLFADRKTVVEGYWATECFHQLLVKKGAEAPIMEQVYNILYKGVAPRDAVGVLMSRQLKME